jgi:NAD-dependent deacetylase
LIDMLKRAQRIVVLTGAGVSAESGLATFRDKQAGLWERFRPMQLATPEAFEQDPQPSYGDGTSGAACKSCSPRPNAGHLAIKEFADHVPAS